MQRYVSLITKYIKEGAIVPETNELYAQVEESVAADGWQTLPDGWAPPKPPMTLEDYHNEVQGWIDKTKICMSERLPEAIALGNTTWQTQDVIDFLNWRASVRALLDAKDMSAEIPEFVGFPAGT
jgi:hypothetical protein